MDVTFRETKFQPGLIRQNNQAMTQVRGPDLQAFQRPLQSIQGGRFVQDQVQLGLPVRTEGFAQRAGTRLIREDSEQTQNGFRRSQDFEREDGQKFTRSE